MRRNMNSGNIKLVGYILPRNTDHENEDSEDEEKVPDFLDMMEMNIVSAGGFTCQQSVPPTDEVNFMFNGKKVRVLGRFPLRNPWWEISCSAKQHARKLVVNGFPGYKLRTDLKNDVISLFLKECGVDCNFVMDWLANDKTVTLQNLEENLCEFAKSSKDRKQASDYVRIQISNSDAAFYVKTAIEYPNIMKHLPTLLPGHFLKLLETGKAQEMKKKKSEQSANPEEESMKDSPQKYNTVSLLARLEELIKTEVWKFGFSHIMCEELHFVGCETTLKNFETSGLYKKLTLLQQNALKVYDILKYNCRQNGHTYMEQKLLNKLGKMPEVSNQQAVDFLCHNGVLILENGMVALRNLYIYEKNIAKCLKGIIEGEPWIIDLDIEKVLTDRLATTACSPASETEETQSVGVTLDPDQVKAAKMMCCNPVTIISGKGGCGKTTVVSTIFKAAMEQQKKNRLDDDSIFKESQQKESDTEAIEVLLTAPTGRAAALLTEKTCFTAYTMHQILWSFMTAKKESNGSQFKWKFNKVSVLVVDEGSLVCVKILYSILMMLTKYAQLKKFIILGDIRQLPSIEPGNVLSDLFTSLKTVNWAIEMSTNHRAESKLIVENACLIADMGARQTFYHLNYDATVELSKTDQLPSPEKSFIEILLPENQRADDLQNSIKFLLKGPTAGLNDAASSQFIAFKRNECALINELCCQHYSKHPTKTHQKKKNFQIGDKVCCTRNGYVTEKDEEDKAKATAKEGDMEQSKIKKERLCNGEIFFITQDVTTELIGKKHSKRRYLTLDNKQGKILTVDYRELMRECKLQHAWARTIHTFQGSEEKTIVFVLAYAKHQTWKHVYTAVTRGQSRVYVIAKQGALKKAIQGHVIRRNTRLKGHVIDMLQNLQRTNTGILVQANLFEFNTPKQGPYHGPASCSGLSQACPEIISKNAHLNNPTNGGNWLGDFFSSKSKSPCKRESITDNCTVASKRIKDDTPLSSPQLQCLSPNITPRQLFPKASQSIQDQ